MAKAKKTKKISKVAKPKAKKPKAATKVKAKKAAPKKQVLKSKAAKKPQAKAVAPKNKSTSTKNKSVASTNKSAAPKLKDNSKIKWSEFVTPLDDRIIVQISNAERKTAGGLYIPDTTDLASQNTRGIAVSVGRGHRNKNGKLRPMDVQVGDRLVFSEYSGSKIELLGETLILLRESEVMGIVTK